MSRTPTLEQAQWMTLSEASRHLGVAQVTIRRWADSGKLPVFKTPGGHRRFRQDDLDAFMSTTGSASVPESRYGGSAHVLVVDDDPQVREMLCECLQAQGFSVAQSDSARTALLSINQRVPDLMMVDVSMPGMDGWEMLRRIREKLDVEDLPVIIFSGVVSASDLQSAPSRGANAYFRKPFDPTKLVGQAKAILTTS
jgi:excisionase family DNA binding protein